MIKVETAVNIQPILGCRLFFCLVVLYFFREGAQLWNLQTIYVYRILFPALLEKPDDCEGDEDFYVKKKGRCAAFETGIWVLPLKSALIMLLLSKAQRIHKRVHLL